MTKRDLIDKFGCNENSITVIESIVAPNNKIISTHTFTMDMVTEINEHGIYLIECDDPPPLPNGEIFHIIRFATQ